MKPLQRALSVGQILDGERNAHRAIDGRRKNRHMGLAGIQLEFGTQSVGGAV
jgi:hypothetical protein